MTAIDRGHRPDAYYYHLTPACPGCDIPFPEGGEHIDTFHRDDVVHQIIECTDCAVRWELHINYDKPAIIGIEAWIRPAVHELQPYPT